MLDSRIISTVISCFSNTLFILALVSAQRVYCQTPILQNCNEEAQAKADFIRANPACSSLAKGELSALHELEIHLQEFLQADTTGDAVWPLFYMSLVKEQKQPGLEKQYLAKLDTRTKHSIVRNWMLGQAYLEQGLKEYSDYYFNRAHKIMLEQGYLKIPEFAAYFLFRAKKNMQSREFSLAEEALNQALKFDPYCVWVALFKVQILLKEHPPWKWNPIKISKEIGLAMTWLEFYHARSLTYLNIFRTIRISLGMFFTISLPFPISEATNQLK